jgi:hypothetical protein
MRRKQRSKIQIGVLEKQEKRAVVVVGWNVVGWNREGEPIEGSLPYRMCTHCGWGDWDLVSPCPRCGAG